MFLSLCAHTKVKGRQKSVVLRKVMAIVQNVKRGTKTLPTQTMCGSWARAKEVSRKKNPKMAMR